MLLIYSAATVRQPCSWSALDAGVEARVTTPTPGSLLSPADLPENFNWRVQTIDTDDPHLSL
jgi:hypothetical protein